MKSYGANKFAKLLRSKYPNYHPARIQHEKYISPSAVESMLKEVGPDTKLVEHRQNRKRTYTSHKLDRKWSNDVIAPTLIQLRVNRAVELTN